MMLNRYKLLLFVIFYGITLYHLVHTGMKPTEDPLEEMNSMDDDLLSLLDNFPSAMPAPEWYRGGHDISNGQSPEAASDNIRLNTQQNASPAPVATASTPELEWGIGSCYWKNMPGIC